MVSHRHQAQFAGLEFHNVAIDGIRPEHTQSVGVLLIDDFASIEHLHDFFGLARSFANPLVLHGENIIGLNITKEVATEVDAMIKASAGNSTGVYRMLPS